MKRSAPLKRYKPLPRAKQPIARKTRVRPINRKRKARLFLEQYGDGYADWLRDSCRCCVSGSAGSEWDPIVAAHVRSRGAGGKWYDLVPLRQSLHMELHAKGAKSFALKYPHVDLTEEAAIHAQRWLAFTNKAA